MRCYGPQRLRGVPDIGHVLPLMLYRSDRFACRAHRQTTRYLISLVAFIPSAVRNLYLVFNVLKQDMVMPWAASLRSSISGHSAFVLSPLRSSQKNACIGPA